MSQTGTITSCGGNAREYGSLNWVVDFSYQLDVGGVGQSRVLVGNNPNLPGFTVRAVLAFAKNTRPTVGQVFKGGASSRLYFNPSLTRHWRNHEQNRHKVRNKAATGAQKNRPKPGAQGRNS
jgi:hypothetical protein